MTRQEWRRVNVVWMAGRDGIAHGRRGMDPRTLCGQLAVSAEYARNELQRCPACVRVIVMEPPRGGDAA